MSYLDPPRIYFIGNFFPSPSTINNSLPNYSLTAVYNDDPPSLTNPNSERWNPNGPALFHITATVGGACLELGTPITSDDPVIGATIASVPWGQQTKVQARLVDLDPDQQGRTLLIGLQLQITTTQGVTITGTVRGMTLIDSWGRMAGSPGGITTVGGMYQSVIDNVQWQGMSGNTSPVLQQLLSICQQNGSSLSIKLNLDGFTGTPTGSGRIVGTIGPYCNGEPAHVLAKRRMWPGSPLVKTFWPVDPQNGPTSPLNAAPFQIANGYLSLDLGNSIQTQGPSSQATNPLTIPFFLNGTVNAIADPNGANIEIGTVCSSPQELGALYDTAAGILDLPLTSAQEQALANAPLALQLLPTSGTAALGALRGSAALAMKQGFTVQEPPASVTGPSLVLAEDPTGLFSSFDFNALRLQNGAPSWSESAQSGARVTGNAEVPLYATKFGQATPLSLNIHMKLDPLDGRPISAITFPAAVQTDNAGMALVNFIANDLSLADIAVDDPRRKVINSQLYFFTMDGEMAADTAPITILVFENTPGPASPTWQNDIAPIFTQYSRLYPFMTQNIVDLSSFDAVVAPRMAQAIQTAMSLPPEDPGFMPVTRDLAPVQLQMILAWFNNNTPE